MKQYTILIVFWELGLGGIQRRIIDISRILGKAEYASYHAIFLLRDKPRFRLDEFVNRHTTHIVYTPTSKFRSLRFIHFFFSILFHTWRLKPVVILTFLDYLSFLCVLVKKIMFWRSVRIVLSEETFPSMEPVPAYRRFLVPHVYPHSNRIIVQTQAVQQDLIHNFHIPPEKISVIPGWVPNKHRKQRDKKNLEHTPSCDILYAGRFSWQKDIFFLLKAVKILKPRYRALSVCLIGEGKDEEDIRTYIQTHNLTSNVSLRKSVVDIAPFFATSKIAVLTSRYESMPIFLLEAMKAKKPTVVRRFPGVEACVVSGKTTYVVDTPEQFAEKTILLLSNPKLRRQMGENANRYAKNNFSQNNMRKFLDEVIGKPLKQ